MAHHPAQHMTGTSSDRETHRQFMSPESDKITSEQAVQTDCREGHCLIMPKAPSSHVLKRRAAVWLTINSSSGATPARG